MPSTAIVDVAIGIAFVYLFFSLICSVVNEAIAAILSLRAKNLVAGIDSLFSQSNTASGESFVASIYDHGLIRGLFKNPPKSTGPVSGSGAQSVLQKFKGILPAYIPAQTFAQALVDVISPPKTAPAAPGGAPSVLPRTLYDVRESIAALPDSPTKSALLCLVTNTQKDVAEFQQKVEDWYNDSMQRAAGWYKRQAQKILLALGLLVAVGMNVDSIHVAVTLWTNPSARQATVDLAQEYVAAHKDALKPAQPTPGQPTPEQPNTAQPASDAEALQKQAAELRNLSRQIPIPFGWGTTQHDAFCAHYPSVCKPSDASVATAETLAVTPLHIFEKLVGWLITALALSLGAPFWFDTLNKFMAVRTSLKPKEDNS